MKVSSKIKKIIGSAILGLALIVARPSQSFVWPTVDFTMISSFVSNISTGLGQVTTAIAQIKGYAATISAIGDQVSAIAKFADVMKTITSIVQNIQDVAKVVKTATTSIGSIMDNFEKSFSGFFDEMKQLAETTTQTINKQVEEDEEEQDVQETLTQFKEEVETQDENIKKEVEEVRTNIKSIASQATETVDTLVKTIITDGQLDENTSKSLQEEASEVKDKINNLQIHADKILDQMLEEHNAAVEDVMSAVSDYSAQISLYYNKEITKEDLIKAGEKFNSVVSSKNTNVNRDEIKELMSEAESIVTAIDNLTENIVNSIANNKDYSDSDDEEKTSFFNASQTKKYVFSYHTEHHHMYLKRGGLYNNNVFLLPRGFRSATNSKCKNVSKDTSLFKKADTDRKSIVEGLNDCVVRAKTEKEYFCPGSTEEQLNKCDPYEKEDYFKSDSYRKYGVYKHVFKDYSEANISNIAQIKQYIMSWEDLGDSNSIISKLMDELNKVDTTANAYSLHGMIDIEEPKLWSLLRRVDALDRARNIVNYYRELDTLYLDGRDADYKNAQNSRRGNVDVDIGDGETKEASVISHSFLYICAPDDSNISGENISVSAKDSGDASKIKVAETNIKKCLYNYATGATRGVDLTGSSDNKTLTGIREDWRIKEIKAITDSMLHTLVLSTINTYKSSRDLANPEGGEKTIVSLQEKAGSCQTNIEDYSSGAEINNYAGQQVLSILEADAQSLQTEIIQDIRQMSYNFFDEEVVDEKGE